MLEEINKILEDLERQYQEYKIQAIDLIRAYKSALSQTDYKALKYMDGALSEEEYSIYKDFRQKCRSRITDLEPMEKEFRPNSNWFKE